MPDLELDVAGCCLPPEFPEGASDEGVHGPAQIDGCYYCPVVTEDEDCRTGEGREPEASGDEEVPTLEAGDGKAEVLDVVRVVELAVRQAATSL